MITLNTTVMWKKAIAFLVMTSAAATKIFWGCELRVMKSDEFLIQNSKLVFSLPTQGAIAV
ncbi:MAG: hypothetical protein KME59_17675 [Trichormus sp. ATA11-4-KO1]|jgi:hypothetical protein|nr:hypothetical protein [Trichormus sp. ATA11-4-KO1]